MEQRGVTMAFYDGLKLKKMVYTELFQRFNPLTADAACIRALIFY